MMMHPPRKLPWIVALVLGVDVGLHMLIPIIPYLVIGGLICLVGWVVMRRTFL